MTMLRIAPFAAFLLLLGCNKSSAPTPTTLPQAAKAVNGSADPHSKIIGKWHRKYNDDSGSPKIVVANIEFFSSGDFSSSDYIVYTYFSTAETQTHAGTYKFIDSSHLKLDYGVKSEIYELVSVTDKELRLKEANNSIDEWTVGFGAPPAKQ